MLFTLACVDSKDELYTECWLSHSLRGKNAQCKQSSVIAMVLKGLTGSHVMAYGEGEAGKHA